MDLLTRIIEDALCVEPTVCDNCACLSEWGHFMPDAAVTRLLDEVAA